MQFDTQRLRVQIPCGASGSVVRTADFCGDDDPRSNLTLHEELQVCRQYGTRLQEIICANASIPFTVTPWLELWNPEYVMQRTVLEPEVLPQLREQLELKLKALSVVADATAAARRQIEANLSDIDASEKTLRKMSNG